MNTSKVKQKQKKKARKKKEKKKRKNRKDKTIQSLQDSIFVFPIQGREIELNTLQFFSFKRIRKDSCKIISHGIICS